MSKKIVNFFVVVFWGNVVMTILLIPYSMVLVPQFIKGEIKPFYITIYMWVIFFIVGLIVAFISKIKIWISVAGVLFSVFLITFLIGNKIEYFKNILNLGALYIIVFSICGAYVGYLLKRARMAKLKQTDK